MKYTQFLKKIKRLVLSLAIVFAAASCSDFLDVDEQTKISYDQLFKTVQGTAEALNGAYYLLGELDYYGRNMMVIPDLKGGNLKMHDPNNTAVMSYYHMPAFEFNHSADPEDDFTSDIYQSIYEVIMTVNNVIEYTPLIEDATDDEKNQLLAEARAIRALAHFDLTRLFAQSYVNTPNGQHKGIAYVKKILSFDETLKRDPLYKNYNDILDDLKFAEEHIGNSLAAEFATSTMNYYTQAYFTKASVQALMARVYLYQNDWKNAKDYASLVIATSGASLVPNDDFYDHTINNSPASENLLIINNEGRSAGVPLATAVGYKEDRTANYITMSDDLIDLYEANDLRRSFFVKQLNDTICLKYREFSGGKDHFIPLIRLSEMYLIRAEACLNLPAVDEVQARADLDIIRKRANSAAANINLSGQALKDELFKERRRELALEGHLFFDIARKGMPLVRIDCNANQNVNLDYGDFRYVLPIPKESIDLNGGTMEQNDGY